MPTWKEDSRKGETIGFEAKVAGFRVVVHRHIDYPGDWLLSVYPGFVDKRVLNAKTPEEAKTEATAYLTDMCRKMIRALEEG